jgi:hypothetical protein
MALNSLEQRVTELEREVALLKQSLVNGNGPKDWRRTVGMFEGDATMAEIDRLTLEVRDKDRKKAQRRRTRRKPTKS